MPTNSHSAIKAVTGGILGMIGQLGTRGPYTIGDFTERIVRQAAYGAANVLTDQRAAV